jgi:E3 ubiquitin-protein ligase synoviolin
VLTNLALIWIAGSVYLLQRLLYGRLRPIEVEQLYEKGWVAVTETALALTIFREDIGAHFFIMFVCLTVGKIWTWIGEGRVEFLEQQPPSNPRTFHIRLSASLALSVAFDAVMLEYCINTLLRNAGPGMMVMYAFEFIILLIQSTSLILRFALDVTESFITHRQTQQQLEIRRNELRREREAAGLQGENVTAVADDVDETDIDVPGWEEKGRWIFYLDLASGGCSL